MPKPARTAALCVFLLAAVALGAGLRIGLALGDPAFDAERPDRMLKSDPALLYYLTERIHESGGWPPPDFRADPRIEHPDPTDLPALLTVGQEFGVAWVHALLGEPAPLHVVAVWVMGVVASLAVLGVYGLTFELTGGAAALAAFAAALYVLSPANYRTIGFILVREDLALPLLALALWLLARAARLRSTGAYALAAGALLAALASWHAMGFVVTLGLGVGFLWFLRTGRNPLAEPRSWSVPALLALGSLGVPALASRSFVLSPAMWLLWALLVAALAERVRPGSHARRAAVALATLVLGLGATRLLAEAGSVGLGDYTHVWELIQAKLRFLGQKPADPALVPFGARLLWQGPFETAALRELVAGFTVGCVLLPVAVLLVAPDWWRGRGASGPALLVGAAVGTALSAVLLRRNLVLPGLLTPVVAAVALQELGTRRLAPWALGLALAQAFACASILPHREVRWYFPLQQEELGALLPWMREQLPAEGAVATDFVNGSAVLAATRHPILLQPKYEARESRQRTEEFLRVFFWGTPEELRAWLKRYDARYLLVDRQTLWNFRWVAGLPEALELPVPGTASHLFLSQDPRRLESVPGFRLLYRSDLPQDMLRLFEVR